MVKFNDSHKEEQGGEYFELGVHEVVILEVNFDKTQDDKEYVDFTVTDETQTKQGTARLWFTTDGAIKYTFNIIRGIFVHNAPDDTKDAIRKKVDGVKDTDELAKLCQLLVGKTAWYEVSEDATRTYMKDGVTKPSLNKNITGYKPTPKKVSAPATEAAPAQSSSPKDDDVMAGF